MCCLVGCRCVGHISGTKSFGGCHRELQVVWTASIFLSVVHILLLITGRKVPFTKCFHKPTRTDIVGNFIHSVLTWLKVTAEVTVNSPTCQQANRSRRQHKKWTHQGVKSPNGQVTDSKSQITNWSTCWQQSQLVVDSNTHRHVCRQPLATRLQLHQTTCFTHVTWTSAVKVCVCHHKCVHEQECEGIAPLPVQM